MSGTSGRTWSALTPLFIGETDDFAEAIRDHRVWAEVLAEGVVIHILAARGRAADERRRFAGALRARYHLPRVD